MPPRVGLMVVSAEPIEAQFRRDEILDLDAALVIRGWPLTVEVTTPGWGLDSILSGSRLRTRRSYAATMAHDAIDPASLLARWRIVCRNYTEDDAQRLISVLGDVVPNPHHVRRES